MRRFSIRSDLSSWHVAQKRRKLNINNGKLKGCCNDSSDIYSCQRIHTKRLTNLFQLLEGNRVTACQDSKSMCGQWRYPSKLIDWELYIHKCIRHANGPPRSPRLMREYADSRQLLLVVARLSSRPFHCTCATKWFSASCIWCIAPNRSLYRGPRLRIRTALWLALNSPPISTMYNSYFESKHALSPTLLVFFLYYSRCYIPPTFIPWPSAFPKPLF